MREKIVLWLIKGWTPRDPKAFLGNLLKQWLPGYHIHENPVGKLKPRV